VQLSEEELEALSAEANVFALASHVYWGVWAIVQARYSPIDFDYMSYSSMRWAEFHRRKEEFVGQARAVLAQKAAAPAVLAAAIA
jgi:ethanolamine kinase